MPDAKCLHCNCDRLMAPIEPIEDGSAIICGQCGALHVLDANPERPVLRKPTREEALELRKIPEVAAALNAYALAVLEQSQEDAAKVTKSMRVKVKDPNPRLEYRG